MKKVYQTTEAQLTDPKGNEGKVSQNILFSFALFNGLEWKSLFAATPKLVNWDQETLETT